VDGESTSTSSKGDPSIPRDEICPLLSHHDEVRLHDVVRRQNHVDRRVEDSAERANLEVVFELPL
jgi:hypothetical protein